MGTMIMCRGYDSGYDNPEYNVQRNVGAPAPRSCHWVAFPAKGIRAMNEEIVAQILQMLQLWN